MIKTHTKFDNEEGYKVNDLISSGTYGRCYKIEKDNHFYCLKVANVNLYSRLSEIKECIDNSESIDDITEPPYNSIDSLLPEGSTTFSESREEWKTSINNIKYALNVGNKDLAMKIFDELLDSVQKHATKTQQSFINEFTFNENFLKETPFPNLFASCIEYNISDKDNPRNLPYILMDYYPDCLYDMIENKEIPTDDGSLMIIIYGIALAIAKMHERELIHRDIKPDNVLLDEYNHYFRPHLSDFGDYSKQEETRKKHGSPYYIAPESRRDQSNKFVISKKSDVFQFGATLYSILTNKIPFYKIGDDNDIEEEDSSENNDNEEEESEDDTQYNEVFDLYFSDQDEWWAKVSSFLDKSIQQMGEISPFKIFLFDKIKETWQPDPETRPSIAEIVSQLEDFQEKNLQSSQAQFDEYKKYAYASTHENTPIIINDKNSEYSSKYSSCSDDYEDQ